MRTTSASYNPFPTVRSPDSLVSFEVLAKDFVKSRVTPSSNKTARVGAVGNVLNGAAELAEKYATLERFGWRLDGTSYVLPDSGAERGFWTISVSQGSGSFPSRPNVTLVLPSATNTFGWTFHFDAPADLWPTRIQAKCYNGVTLLDTVDGYPDGAGSEGNGWSFNHFVYQYDKVVFTFYGMNEPFRMLRLTEIDFGVSRHFNRNTVKDLRIRYGLSPDSSEFPAKEFTFNFDNSGGEFNVLDPIGVYQYWRNGQVLSARIRLGDDSVFMGMFYVTKAEIGDNRLIAKVTAHDECYRLASQKFYPAELAEETSVTLQTAVEAVISGYDMSVDYGGLENELVSLAIRDTHNKRTVLRYLAQAARASVWIDRDGVLRFRRLAVAEEPAGEITPDELYDWSGVSISEQVTGVTLTVERELEEATTETYTAGESDETGANTAVYSNPCVAAANGQDVADWLLVMANWRKKYAVKNRCDPAVEIGDTLRIADAFRNDDNAMVTGIEVTFDGVLSAVTEAAGEF